VARAKKKEIVKEGLQARGIGKSILLYDSYLGKMEEALDDYEWITADSFSLADIGLAPYVNRLDMLNMSAMWTRTRPRVTRWFERIRRRVTFLPQLLQWIAPELTSDLATFGAKSWPEVERLLQDA
jgi:ganglioside-induced differentiation-associated protein 1